MLSITFVCWKWNGHGYRTVYTAEHVNVLQAMLKRHYLKEHRFICVTDEPVGIEGETFPLWKDCDRLMNPSGKHLPSCYRRLKIFSSATTRAMGIKDGARVVSIDLDVVLLSNVLPLFERPEKFVGWKRVGAFHPVAYNGTLFMFRTGMMDWLWDEFDPIQSPRRSIQAKYFGSDQGWISYRLQGGEAGWTKSDGIYSYSSDVQHRVVPRDARIVSFNGKRKPWEDVVRNESLWVTRHWKR